MKALIRNIKVLIRCALCDTEVVFPPSPVSEGIIPAAARAHDLDVTVHVCLTVWCVVQQRGEGTAALCCSFSTVVYNPKNLNSPLIICFGWQKKEKIDVFCFSRFAVWALKQYN